MNARVLFILLVISLLLAVTRRYRKLGIGLSVAVAVLLLWFNIRITPSATTFINSSSSVSSSIGEPTAQLQDMRLIGNGAPWRLLGEVRNTSNVALRALSIEIERLDCPAVDSVQTDCTLLWRGTRVVRLDVISLSNAKIDESFYSHDAVPRVAGVARDRITLMAVE